MWLIAGVLIVANAFYRKECYVVVYSLQSTDEKYVPIELAKVLVYCSFFFLSMNPSHMLPLTFQPCCHFARNACMKGDDCPFDHELGKYPCNNFVSTGYCSRGNSCLFSHKVIS